MAGGAVNVTLVVVGPHKACISTRADPVDDGMFVLAPGVTLTATAAKHAQPCSFDLAPCVPRIGSPVYRPCREGCVRCVHASLRYGLRLDRSSTSVPRGRPRGRQPLLAPLIILAAVLLLMARSLCACLCAARPYAKMPPDDDDGPKLATLPKGQALRGQVVLGVEPS